MLKQLEGTYLRRFEIASVKENDRPFARILGLMLQENRYLSMRALVRTFLFLKLDCSKVDGAIASLKPEKKGTINSENRWLTFNRIEARV